MYSTIIIIIEWNLKRTIIIIIILKKKYWQARLTGRNLMKCKWWWLSCMYAFILLFLILHLFFSWSFAWFLSNILHKRIHIDDSMKTAIHTQNVNLSLLVTFFHSEFVKGKHFNESRFFLVGYACFPYFISFTLSSLAVSFFFVCYKMESNPFFSFIKFNHHHHHSDKLCLLSLSSNLMIWFTQWKKTTITNIYPNVVTWWVVFLLLN